MVLWVGVDDTDSLRGMCTTFLATEIVRELSRELDLIGYPRLVRLNPNIPWKTRGNGALALRFGRGSGEPKVVGRIDGREVVAYPRGCGSEDPFTLQGVLEALVERWAVFDDSTTNPAFVVLRRAPNPGFYWRAVREIVTRSEARRAAEGLGLVRAYKNGRGVIGATAALSWRPRDRTYEVLAYRDPSLWGLRRDLDSASVVEMDRRFPSTFNNYDYENRKVVFAPHSPCPVLFGIRGDEPEDLRPAMEAVRGEKPERWLLFETNQGTDDHIVRDDWRLRPSTATSIEGMVAAAPRTRSGGHVLFELQGRRRIWVSAYEPSKQFRDVIRALRAGDVVRAYGSVRDKPRTLNLEKLQVLLLAEDTHKVSNPRCIVCGKSMKSMGRGTGYRCPRGHGRAPPQAAVIRIEPRSLPLGFYEPPAGARRHLAKPLKRFEGFRSTGGLRAGTQTDEGGRLLPARLLSQLSRDAVR